MSAEFLLLNGAKINAVDQSGNTSLHLAAAQGSTSQVCLLLKHRADHHIKNSDGHTALDIAVQNSDADIVTLLRFVFSRTPFTSLRWSHRGLLVHSRLLRLI